MTAEDVVKGIYQILEDTYWIGLYDDDGNDLDFTKHADQIPDLSKAIQDLIEQYAAAQCAAQRQNLRDAKEELEYLKAENEGLEGLIGHAKSLKPDHIFHLTEEPGNEEWCANLFSRDIEEGYHEGRGATRAEAVLALIEKIKEGE